MIPLLNLIKDLASSNVLKDSLFLVIGDFNQVLTTSETYSFTQSNLSLQRMVDFRDCLQLSGLFDLASLGPTKVLLILRLGSWTGLWSMRHGKIVFQTRMPSLMLQGIQTILPAYSLYLIRRCTEKVDSPSSPFIVLSQIRRAHQGGMGESCYRSNI